MNASTQAITISLLRKIANVPIVIQSEIPSAVIDLSPWMVDAKSQEKHDPLSIDFGVSFSSAQPHFCCACMLLQIIFAEKLSHHAQKFKGVYVTGHDYCGQYWQFSSVENCQFSGLHVPDERSQKSLKQIFGKVHALFGHYSHLPNENCIL